MGWNPFKSKKVTTVGTSIVRVIQDKDLVDSVKAAMVTSLFSNSDLVDEILETSVNGLGTRVENMYQYAKAHSPYGLPTGEVYANTQGKDAIQAVLDTLEGQAVFIEYSRFGSPNGIHMGWMNLLEYHGYDPVTNQLAELSVEKGTPVYLTDMVLELPAWMASGYDKEEVAVWGKSPNGGYTPERTLVTGIDYAEVFYPASPPVFTNGLLNPQLKVTYTWQTEAAVPPGDGSTYGVRHSFEKVSSTSVFTMPTRAVNTDTGYFHVKYVVGGITKYWMYEYGSGTHPTLDAVFVDSPNVLGDFFPNIYFRLNKVNLATNKTTEEYRINKKLAKYIGMDYSAISAGIHENADIGYVEQAFMTMGVPADSTDPLEQEYLFNFFSALYDATDADVRNSSDNFTDVGLARTMSIRRWALNFRSPAAETITIKDSAFQMDLSNSGILRARVRGSIGSIGAVSAGKAEFVYQTPVRIAYDNSESTLIDTKVPYRFYRKQVSALFYEEIQVVNAQMKYWILGGHHTVQGDQEEELLLIPIDRGILKKFNTRDSERLVSRSLHFVFNSLSVVKVKWYQQEWFGIFLIIVAIVITVFSVGGDGGSSLTSALAVLAGMTAQQILIWIAMKVLIYIVVREVFKLFVKAVGVEIAFIAAIIAMCYGIKLGLEGSTGSLGGLEISAQTMLQTVNGIAQGINMELRSLNADLMGEASSFNLFKQEKLTLLDKAKDLLDSDSILSPFVVLGESPEDYFKRTTHSGNIGIYLIDDVHNYVSRNLQLPDFSASVGGPKYGY